MGENNFKKFFVNEVKEFIGKKYNSIKEFESNFKYYFKCHSFSNFLIIEDNNNNRHNLIEKMFLDYNYLGKWKNYYGQSGLGQTITIIGALKYMLNHKDYGTLYINCNTLFILMNKKKDFEIKQIIIDELPYLFYEEYELYFECGKKIQNYNLENDNAFCNLIHEIMNFLNNNKKE